MKAWNLQWLKNPTPSSSTLVVYLCLKQEEWISFLLNSKLKLESVVEHRTSEEYTLLMASSNKKNKMKSDSENNAAEFPRFIVLESLEETWLAKISPF